MNAFQVRIFISVFVPCHWHWVPLVTTVTPGPILDRDGTGDHGPAAVSTSALRHGNLINLIFIWGRPQWPMGVLLLSWVSHGLVVVILYTHDCTTILVFGGYIGSIAAEVPVRPQATILTQNYIIMSCKNSQEGVYRVLGLSPDCNWWMHRYHHTGNIYYA